MREPSIYRVYTNVHAELGLGACIDERLRVVIRQGKICRKYSNVETKNRFEHASASCLILGAAVETQVGCRPFDLAFHNDLCLL